MFCFLCCLLAGWFVDFFVCIYQHIHFEHFRLRQKSKAYLHTLDDMGFVPQWRSSDFCSEKNGVRCWFVHQSSDFWSKKNGEKSWLCKRSVMRFVSFVVFISFNILQPTLPISHLFTCFCWSHPSLFVGTVFVQSIQSLAWFVLIYV